MPGFNVRRITIGDVKDVHRSHRWAIYSIAGKVRDQWFYAKELTPPSISFEEEVVKGASVEYKFPKSVKYDDVPMTFYDVHGFYKELDEMHKGVWTPKKGIRPAAEFMGDTIFGTTDGSGVIIDQWTLKNSYIKELSHSPLSYGNTDLKTVSLVVSYTWAEYENVKARAGRTPVITDVNA